MSEPRSILGSEHPAPWLHIDIGIDIDIASHRDVPALSSTASTSTPPGTRPSALQTRAPAPTWQQSLRPDRGAPDSCAGEGGGVGAAATRKRPLPTPCADSTEPLHKRRRLPRHTLDRLSYPPSAHLDARGQPPSPLFFSRNTRPQLPARFSSGEAAARMLSKTQGEEGGIRTVTLARGTFSGLSPPGAPSIASASGRSSERSSLPRTASPDARDRPDRDPLRLLSAVGIVELLEQDTRPTFIVDIGHVANYARDLSNLQILFANTALRSSTPTWELVSQPPALDKDHATVFRNWLLSTVMGGANLGPNPMPLEHGGVIWSCYTLRQRLRVVSGAVPTHASASIAPATAPTQFPIPSTSSSGALSATNFQTSPFAAGREPQDYFGSNAPATPEEQPSDSAVALQDQVGPTSPRDRSGIFQTAPKASLPSVEKSSSTANAEHDMGFFDWTRLPMSSSLPRHIQFARSIDWAATSLGPIEYWSNDLRAMCNLIM
jgi:hypothetical protein